MGDRPSNRHSVDRVDNDRGYSKDNCRWATREEQSNNTRANVWAEYNGERHTITQWAKILGVAVSKLSTPTHKYQIHPDEVVAKVAQSPAKRAHWKVRSRAENSERRARYLEWLAEWDAQIALGELPPRHKNAGNNYAGKKG